MPDNQSELTALKGFSRLTIEEQATVMRGYAKLAKKQQRFVIEYLVDLNATQAAIRAGYSKKTAHVQGTQLLAKLSPVAIPLLHAQQRDLAAGSLYSRERWLQEIQRCAFFDPRKLFDSHNNAKDIPDLDDEAAAGIAGFEILEEFSGKGAERESIGYTKKFKFVNKLQALELFGKATGYLKPDMDSDELAQRLANLTLTVNFVGTPAERPTKVVNSPQVQFVS